MLFAVVELAVVGVELPAEVGVVADVWVGGAVVVPVPGEELG